MPKRLVTLSAAALAIAATGLVVPSPSLGQSIIDQTDGQTDGHYQMQAVDGGIARLDTRTGTMDLCRVIDDAIICSGRQTTGDGERARIAGSPDDADANANIDSLVARIEALEQKVAVLEERVVPFLDEESTDVAIDRMQRIFRGFADIVKDLDEKFGDGGSDDGSTDPGDAMPGRT